jgi:beta-glucosidase
MFVNWKQAMVMAFALPTVSAQQPYNNWNLAYEAAEKLVSSWTIEERANISVRNGIAPGYIPFTPVDGTQSLMGFHSITLSTQGTTLLRHN